METTTRMHLERQSYMRSIPSNEEVSGLEVMLKSGFARARRSVAVVGRWE